MLLSRRCFLTVVTLVLFVCVVLYGPGLVSSPTTADKQSSELSHWRLYGGTVINNNGLALEERGEGTMLFRLSSEKKQFQDIAARLESHPISCSHRPLEDQQSLSNKIERFVEALADYAAFHALSRGNSSSLKMVWMCDTSLCGGLADRMRGLTYTFLLALLSKRVLLVDWSDSRVQRSTYLEPNIIDWRLGETERKIVFQNLAEFGKTTSRKSVLHLSLSAKTGTEARPSDAKYRKILQVIAGSHQWLAMRTNLLPSGLLYGRVPKSVGWINEGISTLGLDNLTQFEFDRLMGLTFRYLFGFSSEIVQEIDAARSALGLTGLTYVGVHVRTGFVGTKTEVQPHHYKLYSDPEQWKSELECAQSALNQSKVPIFLATDSNRVKDMAVEEYGDQIRSLKNSVIHVDNLKLPPNRVTDAVREGVKTVWVELVLLAEAHTVIMGNSGYSFLAESLCFIPHSRVLEGVKCKPLEVLP